MSQKNPPFGRIFCMLCQLKFINKVELCFSVKQQLAWFGKQQRARVTSHNRLVSVQGVKEPKLPAITNPPLSK